MSLQNSHMVVPFPSVAVFEDGSPKETIKVKFIQKGQILIW